MQDTEANCGPTAMHNALAAMGIPRTVPECEALCKTKSAGTTPAKLLRALRAVEGLAPVVFHETRRDVALLRLAQALGLGRPVILSVANGTHWVAAIGRLGDRVLVADSDSNELVYSRDPNTLANWWAEKTARPYYGVIL
jgi:hypothetical protein